MRCQDFIFIADANTIILSCNGHPLNVQLAHGAKVDLRALYDEFPAPKEAEEVLSVDAELPVNENVGVEVQTLEPEVVVLQKRPPTPIPDGWKLIEAYNITWAEDLSTHVPLGPSLTERTKTMGKMFVGGREVKKHNGVERFVDELTDE